MESIFDCASSGNLDGLKKELHLFSTFPPSKALSPSPIVPSSCLESVRDSKGSTPLHFAAGNGHLSVCRFLLEVAGGNQKSSDSRRDAAPRNSAIARYTNLTNQAQGRTALHWAARNGHLEVCKLLVEYGNASVDALAKGGVTPLQLAVWMGHVEVCFWLTNEGNADKNFINGWGCTVHHWLGKSPIFTQERDDPQKASSSAKDRLLALCQWLDVDDENTDPPRSCWSAPNDHGQTPLHKAAFGGNMPVLEFLVKVKGISDTHRDVQHNTAADCAERNQQWDAAKYLRLFGNPCCLQAARAVLFPNAFSDCSSNISARRDPPSFVEIKDAFRKLAKRYHPDRIAGTTDDTENNRTFDVGTKTASTMSKWIEVQEAYRLWTMWWKNPEEANALIRSLERHKLLQRELPPLVLWHDWWHQQQRTLSVAQATKFTTSTDFHNCNGDGNKKSDPNRSSSKTIHPKKKPKVGTPSPTISESAMKELEDFERRLVCLLKTLPSRRIPLSKLPKEYEKTWQGFPMIRPKDYRCKKLGYLLETLCSHSVEVVCGASINFNTLESTGVQVGGTTPTTTWVCLK